MPLTTDQKMLTLSRNVIEAFDKAEHGPHPGFRPAHAKGILLTGEFKASTEAKSLTRAPHVERASVPVTVRFSDFAGIPAVADNDRRMPVLAVSRFAFIWRSTFTPTLWRTPWTASRRGPRMSFWNSSTPWPLRIRPDHIRTPSSSFLASILPRWHSSRCGSRYRQALHGNRFLRCLHSVSRMRQARAAMGGIGSCRLPATNTWTTRLRPNERRTSCSMRSKLVWPKNRCGFESSFSCHRMATSRTIRPSAGLKAVS